MASPRVLVVSSSAGHGHVMAARALSGALRRRHPLIDTAQVDALERTQAWYRRTYRWGYMKLVDRAPLAWRVVYTSTDRHISALGHALTRLGGRPFVKLVEGFKPQAILCTHFLPPELTAYGLRDGTIHTKLHVVVTDFDLHRMWHYPEVDRYYVASDLVKARLCLRFGVPENKVLVTGIPVRREFTAPQDPVAVRALYGLDPTRPVVLFQSAGFAMGPMREAILGVWLERRDAQILAMCGKNQRLRRSIARLPRPSGATLHALGFIDDPSALMAVADVVVAKAGGVTVAECLAMGKPLVVSAAIPGQEERNVHALEEAGAGVWAPTPEEVRWRVARLLDAPDRLDAMARAARALARPEAAADIVDALAGDLIDPVVAGPHFHGAP